MNHSPTNKRTISSLEVAEMMGIKHYQVLEKLEGTKTVRGIIPIMTDHKIMVSDFFLESSYKDISGKVNRCYELTKMGCEFLANKFTGEKGVLFTAKYVKRFNEMEQQVYRPSYMIDDPVKRAQQWIEEQRAKQEVETKALMLEQRVAEYEPKISYLDQILKSKGTVTITQIAKDYGMSGNVLNKILHEERVQYKQNKQWLLYREYHSKGYTKSETIDIKRSNGEPDVTMNTRWTQKGRLFIHELLKKRGVIALMDRENESRLA